MALFLLFIKDSFLKIAYAKGQLISFGILFI